MRRYYYEQEELPNKPTIIEGPMKAIIDKSLEKYLSRKLLVWITSTALLTAGIVTSEEWVAIALAYLGSQGLADIATRWKSA